MPEVLREIAWQDVNIAIYERDINSLSEEIAILLPMNISVRSSGSIPEIMMKFRAVMSEYKCQAMAQDVEFLLHQFKKASGADSFRLLFETAASDMCRRFHSDMNDLRMLSTYSGPGTLWLKDDNVNREALRSVDGTMEIVKKKEEIQQVKTGAAVILKGALYPKDETKAIVHKSPEIESDGGRRLMLRLDVNENLLY